MAAKEEVLVNVVVNKPNNVDGAVKNTTKEVGGLNKATKEGVLQNKEFGAALGKVSPGLQGVIVGLQGATRAAIAFIATGVGAVVAAIGLALGALATYFKRSEAGQNDFNKVVRIGTVILGNALDIVSNLGKALFKAFTGDLKGATAALKDSFEGIKNFVTETRDEINKGLAIERIKAATDILERQLLIEKGILEAKISELRLRAEDRGLDYQTRIDLLKEAQRQQDILSEKETKVARNRFIIKQQENMLSDSTKEDLDEEFRLKARLSEIERDNFNKKRETESKLQGLRERANREDEAAVNKRIKDIEDGFKLEVEITEVNIGDKGIITDLYDRFNKKIARDTVKRNETIRASELETFIAQKQIMAARAANLGQFGTLLSVLAGKNKVLAISAVLLQKAAAVGQIVANTAIANAKSVALSPLTLGQPWVGINTGAAILSIATVVAEAAKSVSEMGKFRRGGIANTGGVLNGPSHAQGGIKFAVGGNLGFEAEGGEAIINKRSTALFRPLLSRINQAGGGIPFAAGGILGNESRQAFSEVSRQFDINRLGSLINQVQTILVLEEFEAKQSAVFSASRRAKVL